MKHPKREARAVSLNTKQGRIEGLRWTAADGIRDRPKILCLHGWLDNASSFEPLAQHLDEFDLVAIDLAGHGQSAHRHHTTHYHFADYLWDVDGALQALGWKQCHLLGHSMGASVASLFTAGRPDVALTLSMLDSLGPWTGNIAKAGERLRKSLAQMGSNDRAVKPYDSIEDMMLARQFNARLSDQAARLLVERAAHRVGKHYEWRTDPRLHWISPLVITEDQALSCLEAIETPTLSILANSNRYFMDDETRLESRRNAIRGCRVEFIDGDHHVHMDKPELIAQNISRFITGNQHQ